MDKKLCVLVIEKDIHTALKKYCKKEGRQIGYMANKIIADFLNRELKRGEK